MDFFSFFLSKRFQSESKRESCEVPASLVLRGMLPLADAEAGGGRSKCRPA